MKRIVLVDKDNIGIFYLIPKEKCFSSGNFFTSVDILTNEKIIIYSNVYFMPYKFKNNFYMESEVKELSNNNGEKYSVLFNNKLLDPNKVKYLRSNRPELFIWICLKQVCYNIHRKLFKGNKWKYHTFLIMIM